ncbi:MAG: hypothetical protein JRI32_05800 [Deltaproteobacteria bacterium]|nr:hypothetical protein [Deltaproteobacteria bacterium]
MCETIVKSLTDRRSKVYEFIVAWQMDNGYSPTQAEIRRNHFGFGGLNAVCRSLDATGELYESGIIGVAHEC